MAGVILHLDINVLIFGLDPTNPVREKIRLWHSRRRVMAISAMAWSEFLCGPVSAESVRAWDRILNGLIIPLDRVIAERAASLFNLSGRRPRSLPDCLIAATAIESSASLVTLNSADFAPLVVHGLELG